MSDYLIHKAVDLSATKAAFRKAFPTLDHVYRAGYWLQRKYDGCMVILDPRKELPKSRTGKEYISCKDHMRTARELNRVIIAEAWVPGWDFARISGEFRRGEVSNNLHIVVHDLIPVEDFDTECDLTYEERVEPFIRRINTEFGARTLFAWTMRNYEGNPQALVNDLLDVHPVGYDGMVLRDPQGRWAAGDNGKEGEIIKVKRELAFDLRVTEVHTGVGAKTGRPVYSLTVGFKGLPLGVGSGIPHDFDKVPKVGDIVEVVAMDYSSDGLLREPRFKGIRHDKVVPDA